MGCSNSHSISDVNKLKQVDSNLSKISSNMNLSETIERGRQIIKSINKLNLKLVKNYHTIMYESGACVFVNANIIHCMRCIFFKISYELQGVFEKANLHYIEDSPYISLNMESLSIDTQKRLNVLLDFIIEARAYKIPINQIDKELPELFYILYEDHHSTISEKSKEKINQAINSFQELRKVRNTILEKYKNELYTFLSRNEYYCSFLNKYGRLAINEDVSDIYEIAMLYGKTAAKEEKEKEKYQDKEKESLQLYSSVITAKKTFNEIMENDKEALSIFFHQTEGTQGNDEI